MLGVMAEELQELSTKQHLNTVGGWQVSFVTNPLSVIFWVFKPTNLKLAWASCNPQSHTWAQDRQAFHRKHLFHPAFAADGETGGEIQPVHPGQAVTFTEKRCCEGSRVWNWSYLLWFCKIKMRWAASVPSQLLADQSWAALFQQLTGTGCWNSLTSWHCFPEKCHPLAKLLPLIKRHQRVILLSLLKVYHIGRCSSKTFEGICFI